jgi:uncharacterized membrane protein YhaH (DUF805 family)
MTTPYPAAPVTPAPGAVPLWAPYYGASLPIAFRRFWKKYATFTGRASLSEYWWWTLIQAIVVVVFYILALVSGLTGATYSNGQSVPGPGFLVVGVLFFFWFLATIVPSLALFWRRMHDANLSGAFYFLGLIPFFGGIAVLVLTLLPSRPEGARYDMPS